MNWISIIAASFVSLLTGFVWYGFLFKNAWVKASGVNPDPKKGRYHPAMLTALMLVLSFIVAIGLWKQINGLHLFVDKLKGGNGVISQYPFFHGMLHGFQNSFLFGAIPVLAVNSLYDQRDWKYLLINIGYWVLTISLMGGLVGLLG